MSDPQADAMDFLICEEDRRNRELVEEAPRHEAEIIETCQSIERLMRAWQAVQKAAPSDPQSTQMFFHRLSIRLAAAHTSALLLTEAAVARWVIENPVEPAPETKPPAKSPKLN